jgi:hypothetical protein
MAAKKIAASWENWHPGQRVPLSPPGFRPRPPKPSSPIYQERHPTRYEWREDVEQLVRRLYRVFSGPGGPHIHINTYHRHPAGPSGYYDTIWCRDTAAFDVWGPDGRIDEIGFERGQRVFDYVFYDPRPPWIDWCIWRRWMWVRGSGWERFGTDPFSFHDDHIHFTFTGPYRILP